MINKWTLIEDRHPKPHQPITARIMHMGKEIVVKGMRDPKAKEVVLFDFYSGVGYENIIAWRPRELPLDPKAHPYKGIENHGAGEKPTEGKS